jgi:hypothetical protein
MAHINTTLPREIELGAVRRRKYQTEIVTTDGGHEVRNARWSAPLRTYEISFPPSRRDDPNYIAVCALFDECLGGLHTFSMTDWTDGSTVKVRFDSDLSLTGIDPRYDHIDSLTVVEVRE